MKRSSPPSFLISISADQARSLGIARAPGEPRIWLDSEWLRKNADLLENYFQISGPFADLVRLGRWNERRRQEWERQFVEGMRRYAAWLEQQETKRRSSLTAGRIQRAEDLRTERARKIQRSTRRLEALVERHGSQQGAILNYLKTKAAPKRYRITAADDADKARQKVLAFKQLLRREKSGTARA